RPRRPRALSRREGLRRRRRHIPDRGPPHRARFRGRDHPVYTGAHESPGRPRGRPGQPGDGRARQVRREAAVLARVGAREEVLMPFAKISDALEDIRDGKMVVVLDDEDRENEGDLTIAAEKVTPEVINFMARYGRGLICLPMTGERLDVLRIPLMVRDEANDAKFGTAFCVPIEAKQGTTTGISAADRARTVLAAVDPR